MKKLNQSLLKKPLKSHFYILDIDSTLVSTHQRNQAILNQFIFDYKKTFPNEMELLQKANCQWGDYGYYSTLKRIEFNPSNKEILPLLESFWRQHFFSNFYLNHDVAMLGATQWVSQLERLGVEFVYLTARHKASMWSGTLESLALLGFPISENKLFLKEDLNQTDEDYKISILKKLIKSKDHKKVFFIDNEPVVLHKVLETFPAVNLVWFHSTHSGKKQPPQEALEINHFNF